MKVTHKQKYTRRFCKASITMGNIIAKCVSLHERNDKPAAIKQASDKDALLIKAVVESDIMTVTELVKCVEDLDPDIFQVADEIAQEKGHGSVIKLMDLAKRKMKKKKISTGSYKTNYSTEIDPSLPRSNWSPSTIISLKEMVNKSSVEVWASLEMNGEMYSAQIIMVDYHLLLKSLSRRVPSEDSMILPYHKIKSLFERNHITVFLEINICQEEEITANRFVHIDLIGFEGRTHQFKCMCTGEIDGIAYANTTFLDVSDSPVSVIWGGARNDGGDTALPGLSTGTRINYKITPGLVAGFYHISKKRKPTHFVIYMEESSYYAEDAAIGKVVHGLRDIELAHSQAKLCGAGSIRIEDCGIVLD